ncbi:MAG TPA: LLM class flavin-dependent oxidoreductase [Vicinamibacterales bacterium]|nr:LLM class flavin-dependent oxidoreductase [Vicinamibacterales bacterium]
MIPLSVLDLAPVSEGFSARDSLRDSVDLAQLCERLGYVRFWFAEHHGMPNIACSAPEILIEHVASATSTIRVGSGGIMLPNHAPLRVAENFHTLAALHPDRIDLGVGRAPGTDPATSRALHPFDAEQFPQQLQELVMLSRRGFPPGHPFATVRVVPEGVPLPPIWVLASSGATAAVAGAMGFGYGFARHFSPAPPGPAIAAYRAAFTPSDQFPAPHVILGVAVVCAPTDEEADYLATSSDVVWVRRHRGDMRPFPSPEEASTYEFRPEDRPLIEANRQRQFVGSPARVAANLRQIAADTNADEVMVTTMIYGKAERLRSYELLARAWTTTDQSVSSTK